MQYEPLRELKKKPGHHCIRDDGRIKIFDFSFLDDERLCLDSTSKESIKQLIIKQMVSVNSVAFCITGKNVCGETVNLDLDFDIHVVYDKDFYRQKYWYYRLYSANVTEYESMPYGRGGFLRSYTVGNRWANYLRDGIVEGRIA